MGALLKYGTVLFAAGLFLSGLALGHRLAANAYKARMAQKTQTLLVQQARIQHAADARIRAIEHREAQQLAAISTHYQQELRDAKSETTRTLAELRIARRLYIPIQSQSSRSGGMSATAPAASFRDGEKRAELSAAAARFLVEEAARADRNTRQLRACQAVVRADRD